MRSFTDVHDALAARGVEHEIIHLPFSSRTAQLAAEALGVPVSTVVKSLLFVADGQPVLALVGGDATVDTASLTRELGVRGVMLARGREVRDLTGYKPGAVPPVGLATDLPWSPTRRCSRLRRSTVAAAPRPPCCASGRRTCGS